MPKRKAVRGRRGGGTAGRKTAEVAATEGEGAEVTTDLNISKETAVDLEFDTVNNINEDLGTEHVADEVLSFQRDETVNNINENLGTEHVADEVLSFQQDETVNNINDDLGTEHVADEVLSFQQDETDHTLDTEPSSGMDKNATKEEELSDSGLCKKNPDNVEIVAETCQQLEEIKDTIPLEEAAETNSKAEDTILATSHEDEWSVAEQLEEELLGNADSAGDNEKAVAEVCFMDKEEEADQTEVEEIQYIDEEANEDQQLSDIMDHINSQKTNDIQNSESRKENDTTKQSENPVHMIENCEVSDDLKKATAKSQEDEEVDNSKFEEISEGSIDQDQEELNTEVISDVEIIGEYFVPKKAQNKKNVNSQEGQTAVHYKEAESLEEVFFATENDFMKITAEDKDNDDISDASLSDHADANLSLEEISDDDLEPSRKRRKPSGMTPIKSEKIDANTKPDIENVTRSDEKSDRARTNPTIVTLTKRPASDNIDGNSSKRFKMSSERKSSEAASPKIENESGMCGDSKKEGKKLPSEIAHGRSVLHKGNLLQSFKNEQQESRERSLTSRDLIEHKRKCELVSSACQTEPRLLKGKIIQCNINPIKSLTELEQSEKISETVIPVSKLLNKFRKQLPSSIPEKIFLNATSLQPPQRENTYSFSLGPVTLSDMDCPKFRDLLRVPEEFNLAFDKHYQGILKASLARHENLSSLMSQLKRLELGNRYMVMSVVYKYGLERNVGIWKATLMFMYEQDIQVERQNLVSDGKVRAKLCLKGVPKGVSKDFIQLLFPEAVSVSTGPGSLEERIIMLGFSSTKMVEEILSCYDLLIICGSQIKISHIDSPKLQEDLAAGTGEESGSAIRKDEVYVNLEQETESCEHQKGLKLPLDSINKNKNEDSIHDQMKQDGLNSDSNTDGLPGNLAVIQDQKEEDLKATENIPLLNTKDSCVEATQTTVETEMVCTADLSAGDVEKNVESIEDYSAVKQNNGKVTSISNKVKNEIGETVVAISEDTPNSTSSENADVDKPSESFLDESAMKLRIAAGEEAIKPESSMEGNTIPEIEMEKNIELSADAIVEDKNRDTPEGKISDGNMKNTDAKKSDREVNALEKAIKKETNDENLEDVSDEEILNQSKHEEPDVVILKEDTSQWVAANIDLTNDESNASVKVFSESSREEKCQQPINHARKNSDSKVKTSVGDSEYKKMDPKLVMTDGSLEVSMEVINVDEGDQELDKVIYARTWRPSRDRSRERNIWDPVNSKATPYVQMPVRENRWSHTSRSGAHYNLHDPYKHYPDKESESRMPRHYYSRSSREGSPRYRAPAREQTSKRRDTYLAKHRRYDSPSPTRDLTYQGHASYNKHWNKRHESWRPSSYEDSRRTESSSRPVAETSGRQEYLLPRSTAQHSSHTWREDQHNYDKPGDRYSHVDSRGPHKGGRRHDIRKSRSLSPSNLSVSSEDHLPPVRKTSYRKESPKRPVLRTSRSPISVSSRSHSLSPVSKSPSVDYSPAETGKEELVKTVQHFLELAKGIQQAKKRRPNRSPSPKSPPLRYSSPLRIRLSSPHTSGNLVKRTVRTSRQPELQSPPRMRSRSPPPSWSRNSRSPSYSRSQRYKYERSPSPSSRDDDYKRHHRNRSYSDRRGSPRRDSLSPGHRYESKKSHRPGDSYDEQGSRTKSGQGSEPKYRSSSDQLFQQSYGSYQVPQSSGPVTASSIYNPACPPPGCPPQQQPSGYSSSSVPLYQYSNPSQFNYSSIPPPYVPPPAPISQSYQSAYSVYQPPQPYVSTGHHSASMQTSAVGNSSNNSSSKNKKSWSMGSSSMVFQRVLGSDNKGDKKSLSGVIEKIEDRERLERPKYTKPKPERVLTKIQMEKK